MLTTSARALGGELRRVLAASGLSVRQVAKLIGRGHASLSEWQHGRSLPSRNDVLKLLDVLEVLGDDRARILRLVDIALQPTERGLAGRIARDIVADPGSGTAVRAALEALAAHCDPTDRLTETALCASDLRAIAAHIPGA
jgi:transcriptional regulator with XRE-family HTH domain